MKLLVLSYLLTLGCGVPIASCQSKGNGDVNQHGECTINLNNANHNTASLVCFNLEPQVADQLKAIADETRRGDKKLDLIISLLRSQIRVNAARERSANGADSSGLKTRAFALSGEILQFLVNRQVVPGFGQAGFGETPFGGIDTSTEAYQKQTVGMYNATFQDRVSAIREALAVQDLTDSQLDIERRNPANAYSVKEIAQRIAGLAEKLK